MLFEFRSAKANIIALLKTRSTLSLKQLFEANRFKTGTICDKGTFAFVGININHKCDVLRDLVPFLQFKKREKHQINTPPWVFFTFFKLYKWSEIVQHTTNSESEAHYLKLVEEIA